MEQQPAATYELSGKRPPLSFLFAAIAILVLVPVLGGIYGVLMHFTHWLIIPVLLLLFFYPVTIALSVIVMLRLGKLRCVQTKFWVSLIAGIWGVYCCWVMKIYFLSDFAVFSFSPLTVLQYIGIIAKTGSWYLLVWQPTGFILYLSWAIEASIIVFFTVGITSFSPHGVFCETCNRWVGSENEKKQCYDSSLNAYEVDDLVAVLKSGNYLQLKTLSQTEEGKGTWVDHHSHSIQGKSTCFRTFTRCCTQCEALHLLTLQKVILTKDDKGEITEFVDVLGDNVLLTPSEFEALREGALPESEDVNP